MSIDTKDLLRKKRKAVECEDDGESVKRTKTTLVCFLHFYSVRNNIYYGI